LSRCGSLLVLLLVVATAATAQDRPPSDSGEPITPQAWLERMNQALATRAFVGTLVFLRDGQLDALRVEQSEAAGTRLQSLSGELIELATADNSLRLTEGGRSAAWPVSADGLRALAPRRPPETLYELRLAGQDRIAGRPAQLVELRPRDGFRYGYRLWLDLASGLPSKSQTIGADGRAVEQMMFTDLVAEEASATTSVQPVPEGVSATGGETVAWRVMDVPAGFAASVVADGETVHLLYSDGIAKVSIYIEPLRAEQPTLSGQLGRGALNAFGRVAHGRQIIVMGDVPSTTVERFAQGVVPRGPEHP